MSKYRFKPVVLTGVFLLASVFAGCTATRVGAVNDDGQLDTVLIGVMRASVSVRSAKGTVKVHEWRKHYYGRITEGETTYKVAVEGYPSWMQKYRCERTTRLIKNGPDSTEENPEKLKLIEPGHVDSEITSFDGDSLTRYNSKGKSAHIEPCKTDYPLAFDLPYIMNVNGMLLNRPGSHTFSDGLTVETKARILKNESVNDSDCTVLEYTEKTTPPGKAPFETVSILWVDTNKGYAVTKIQDYNVVSGSRVLSREMKTDLKDYGNGQWEPSKCVIEEFEAGKDGKRELTLRKVVTYDPKFQINAKLAKDDLSIKLPKGTRVEDKVLNKTYTIK